MRLDAPARMTLQQVYNLAEAANNMLAVEVLKHIAAYVAPALVQAPLSEVCGSLLPNQFRRSLREAL